MALEVIHTAPSTSQFTPLSEHQAQTPGTFFGGRPVLYHHSPNTTIAIPTYQLSTAPAFSSLLGAKTNGHHANGTSSPSPEAENTSIPGTDVWITSAHFVLFSPTAGKGVQISYPSISLHAQQGRGLYMQISLSDSAITADEDLVTVELTITPAASAAPTQEGEERQGGGELEGERSRDEVLDLFAALTACADLHPDPNPSDDGQDGGFGGLGDGGAGAGAGAGSIPGAGGWITSENMHEFMDEEGNFKIPEFGAESGGQQQGEEGVPSASLGAGAGTRRTAEEFDDAEPGVDGVGAREGVEGAGEENKWRRTA